MEPNVLRGSGAGEERAAVKADMRPDLTPLLFALCFLDVWDLSHVEEMKSQERMFLSSLGLSGPPRAAGTHLQQPQARSHVPSALWRMFRRSENLRTQESEPCTVSEYGVRGNIIRYVQDQGNKVTGLKFAHGPKRFVGLGFGFYCKIQSHRLVRGWKIWPTIISR